MYMKTTLGFKGHLGEPQTYVYVGEAAHEADAFAQAVRALKVALIEAALNRGDVEYALDLKPWAHSYERNVAEPVNTLHAEIKAALEGDSNDAEHDALVSVAEHLGIDWIAEDDLLEGEA